MLLPRESLSESRMVLMKVYWKECLMESHLGKMKE